MNRIRIGTRGSALALWQANHIAGLLQLQFPQLPVEQIIIKTEGDKDQKSSLTQIGGQGVFTKTIEDKLLSRQIDVAVHSLKDLPSTMAEGLMLAAVPQRGPVRDVLVTEDGRPVQDLKQGALVATGSIRRRSQLAALRPDLTIADLRGNIHTRLRKLTEHNLDGIIMAEAAIKRLELKDVRFYPFSVDEMIPGVGQGAIGVQIRENEPELLDIVQALNEPESMQAALAERAFLRRLDSGCQFPVGALAEVTEDQLTLRGFVGSFDGTVHIKETLAGAAADAALIGKTLAKMMIDRGAMDLLQEP